MWAIARDRGEAVVGPVASSVPGADEEEDVAAGAGEDPRVHTVTEEPASGGVPEI